MEGFCCIIFKAAKINFPPGIEAMPNLPDACFYKVHCNIENHGDLCNTKPRANPVRSAILFHHHEILKNPPCLLIGKLTMSKFSGFHTCAVKHESFLFFAIYLLASILSNTLDIH